jgi:hypothetical protein
MIGIVEDDEGAAKSASEKQGPSLDRAEKEPCTLEHLLVAAREDRPDVSRLLG